MSGAESSIRSGVAKIESELPGLNLDRHGIGRRWREINVGPSFHSEDSKGQNFGAYDQNGGNHQTLGAAGKFLQLRVRSTVGELPDKKRQNKLCGKKRDSSLGHGLRHLLIDQRTVRRNILRRRPGMEQDGNRRSNRDYDDGDRKEFRHRALV